MPCVECHSLEEAEASVAQLDPIGQIFHLSHPLLFRGATLGEPSLHVTKALTEFFAANEGSKRLFSAVEFPRFFSAVESRIEGIVKSLFWMAIFE